MFSLSELAPLNQHQDQCKLLKPWWEVFMDYLGVLMLLSSVLACTEQLSRDKLLCIPLDPLASTPISQSDNMEQMTSQQRATTTPTINSQPHGRRTHLVYQQYVYISQVCYNDALPFCARFFPYMLLMQSLVLVACGSFWLHFPHTSARIEHFLTILSKCCESPWTSQALSHAAQQETPHETKASTNRDPSIHLPNLNFIRRASMDSGSDSPLLKRAESISTSAPPSPYLSPHSNPSNLLNPQTLPTNSTIVENGAQLEITLDKNDGEQARALFEKVRKFRSHSENSTVIYKVYLAQTVFKLLLVVLIGSYTIPLLSSFSFGLHCEAEEQALVGYSSFQCIHVLSSLLHKLLLAYMSLLGVYGLLNLYTLGWILHSSLLQFSFHSVKNMSSLREVPDIKNDLAFLMQMLDQYDPLLVQRFSVFLSPQTESPPGKEESLEHRWGEEQLKALVTVDTDGRSRLTLVALPWIPSAVYTLNHLNVLRLELITDARFTAQMSNMSSLRELHLYHCSAAIAPGALSVLQDRLEVLHLTFSQPAQLPGWVLSLRGLQQLHLTGHLHSEGVVVRGWSLGSLRHLRHLRTLVIRGMLQRVPGELCEVAGTLERLEIHNEGTRLLALSGLKCFVGLTELILQDCQLERLPSALTTLINLCSLDLQHNRLRTLDEHGGLLQLQHLLNLRLAYNHIAALPPSISALQRLELLDLSNNQLHCVPIALFSLCRLKKLLMSGNLLEQLPCDVKGLQLLMELDLSGNRLESLPIELFSCLKLRVLNASHNYLHALPRGVGSLTEICRLDLRSNCLKDLPCEVVHCSGLYGGGLLVEDWLFFSLPPLVQELLSQSQNSSHTESDMFPYFSPSQWFFHSALETQI